jgi:NAD(P)-dependent dehydrogenase (short-subunit alcohol dehydrogenase family)
MVARPARCDGTGMTTTLITGANKGLGFETARQLVAAGHTVYVGARDEANARRAAEELGPNARPLLIDVTDEASVQAAADRLGQAEDSLDVLINNAGIPGGVTAPGDTTGIDLMRVLDTNVAGAVRVTHAFLPLLLRAKRGIVVNVSSGLGSFSRVTDPERMESQYPALAYAASKAALNMLTVQYAKVFPQLRINTVDPGYTATDLNGHRGTQTVQQGAVAIVRAATLPDDEVAPTGTFIDADGTAPW